MSNFLEDGIARMTGTLLSAAGSQCIYRRDDCAAPDPVSMHKRPQQPMLMDNGNGGFTELLVTDFITDPSTLPFGEPIQGDEIEVDCEIYSVQPGMSTKVFRQMAKSMIRIHTVQRSCH